MQPYIGIDFGTTYSSMAWVNSSGYAQIIKNAEGEDKTPSMVYFGEGAPLVGTPAEHKLEDETERWRVITSVKRSLVSTPLRTLPGGRHIKPIDIVAAILGKLKQDAEEYYFHEPVPRAVITVPATFGTLEQQKIVEAGKVAGFTEVEIAQEPVMAALAYSRQARKPGNHVLVYDLGGGTFDLALLSYDEDDNTFRLAMEPQGRADIGGDDFDHALYDYLDGVAQSEAGRSMSVHPHERDRRNLQLSRKSKETLTVSTETAFHTYLLSSGNGQNGSVPFKHLLRRATLEDLIDQRVTMTIEQTKALLESARNQQIDVDTLVLVGGSSRIPMVESKLTAALAPLKPLRWANQDVAVALGAAYKAHELWGPMPAKKEAPKPKVIDLPTPQAPTIAQPPKVKPASPTPVAASPTKAAGGRGGVAIAVLAVVIFIGLVIAFANSQSQETYGSICVTQYGNCPLVQSQPVDSRCSCSDGFYTYPGVAR